MTDRKFTEDELVELLRAYVERMCGKCNVKDLGKCCNSCFLLPISQSADLINRQKAEIERLKDYNIKLLAANVGLSFGSFDEIQRARAEAIKEFAERLLDEYDVWTENDATEYQYVCGLVNKIVKEMTEERKHD
jgi:hypothetical protein